MDRPDRDALAHDVTRVADRLRSMSDARLSQPAGSDGTRAQVALDLAQLLADACQGVEERRSPEAPRWRVVPDLGVFALGDQVAVTGQDLVTAVDGAGPEEPVWTRAGRRPLGELLAEVAEAVRAVRTTL